MSTRTYLFSVTSMEPVRTAVASKDDSLVEAIVARRRSELRERYSEEEIDADADRDDLPYLVEDLVACDSPPAEESGSRHRVIRLLAAHFSLEPDGNLPFNEGYRHYEVWKNYRRLIARHITQGSDRSLELLQDGRPLRGSHVEHDGCAFSWLTPDEVAELYMSLSQLDETLITDADYTYIHEDLVATLKTIRDRGAWLFLAAY